MKFKVTIVYKRSGVPKWENNKITGMTTRYSDVPMNVRNGSKFTTDEYSDGTIQC